MRNTKQSTDGNTLHTPGPWFVQVDSETGQEVVGRKAWIQARPGSPHVLVHADTGDGDENVLANARLIAAAPALLDALMVASDCIRTISRRPDSDMVEQALDAIRAAIAKAGGR